MRIRPMHAFAAALAAGMVIAGLAPSRAEDDARLEARVEEALRRGFAFLRAQQHENGSWSGLPGQEEKGEAGITGLVLRAMAKAPPAIRKENEAAMEKAALYLARLQQEDGSIANKGTGLTTYRTSIAIIALTACDKERFRDVIAKARAFLEKTQFSEEHGLEGGDAKKSPYYGGWGYDKQGAKPEADLSNVEFALEALAAAGVPAESPVFKRAQVFLQRCQNRSESNDVVTAGVTIGNDGGFMYDPAIDQGKSVPIDLPDGTRQIPSYGSMTYAGLLSFLNAHVGRDDPRVRAAYDWIRRHYTLEENIGLSSRGKPQGGKQGLYYYFHTFAKALNAWGSPEVLDADGTRHVWYRDLAKRLVELQQKDGSWVNDEKRWMEDDKALVSSYALLALDIAHEWMTRAPAPPEKAEKREKAER